MCLIPKGIVKNLKTDLKKSKIEEQKQKSRAERKETVL